MFSACLAGKRRKEGRKSNTASVLRSSFCFLVLRGIRTFVSFVLLFFFLYRNRCPGRNKKREVEWVDTRERLTTDSGTKERKAQQESVIFFLSSLKESREKRGVALLKEVEEEVGSEGDEEARSGSSVWSLLLLLKSCWTRWRKEVSSDSLSRALLEFMQAVEAVEAVEAVQYMTPGHWRREARLHDCLQMTWDTRAEGETEGGRERGREKKRRRKKQRKKLSRQETERRDLSTSFQLLTLFSFLVLVVVVSF